MREIAGKKINITEAEYNYYLELSARFNNEEKNIKGESYFEELFDTDDNGFIISIKTEKSIPWAVLFFIQQVMINQRLRMCDSLRDTVIDKLTELERKVEEIESSYQHRG